MTRTINKISLVIIALVLASFLFQVPKHLLVLGRILPHSFGMLATFLPYAFVFLLNRKRKYFYARLVFLLLPLITTIFWMFVGSSQSGLIHYSYLIFPIPIVILFENRRTQIVLVVFSFLAFLISHLITLKFPPSVDSYYNPYFSIIIFGILMCLSFIMLRFFVSEINQSEKLLQQKNAELEEFSKLAAHDMREPLRTINNFATLIKMKHKEELSGKVVDYLDYIETGVGRLDNLLDDLSNYSMIDSSEEDLKDVDLNLVLENVKKDLHMRIKESKTDFISHVLPTIKARESQIYQLFQNLIQNSIKFQDFDDGSTPILTIKSQTIDGFYHISFQDNGIGIKKEYLDQIFLKFKRLHSRDKYEGTGLGLATCKRIVEKYNGEIGIQSEYGVGTTITLKFMVNK